MSLLDILNTVQTQPTSPQKQIAAVDTNNAIGPGTAAPAGSVGSNFEAPGSTVDWRGASSDPDALARLSNALIGANGIDPLKAPWIESSGYGDNVGTQINPDKLKEFLQQKYGTTDVYTTYVGTNPNNIAGGGANITIMAKQPDGQYAPQQSMADMSNAGAGLSIAATVAPFVAGGGLTQMFNPYGSANALAGMGTGGSMGAQAIEQAAANGIPSALPQAGSIGGLLTGGGDIAGQVGQIAGSMPASVDYGLSSGLMNGGTGLQATAGAIPEVGQGIGSLAAPTGAGAGFSIGTGEGLLGGGIGSSLAGAGLVNPAGYTLNSALPATTGGTGAGLSAAAGAIPPAGSGIGNLAAPAATVGTGMTAPGLSAGQGAVTGAVGNGTFVDAIKQGGTAATDWLKNNPTAALKLGGLLAAGLGGAASKGAGAYDGPMPTISRGDWSPSATPATSATGGGPNLGLLQLPTTGYANSGLWRYGLLGQK
jgi:hypothetical protein